MVMPGIKEHVIVVGEELDNTIAEQSNTMELMNYLVERSVETMGEPRAKFVDPKSFRSSSLGCGPMWVVLKALELDVVDAVMGEMADEVGRGFLPRSDIVAVVC